MEYLAHRNEDGEEQTVKDHSEKTAYLCKEYAIKELKGLCYAIGLFHDVGKYQKTFQKRIRGEAVSVEHSICGAKEFNLDNLQGLIAASCIAGHHCGLPNHGTKFDTADMSTLKGRLKRVTEEYLTACEEDNIKMPELDTTNFARFAEKDCKNMKDFIEKSSFLTRYCFSCLVDADWIDTSIAINGPIQRSLHSNFKECLERLNRKFDGFICETELQKARSKIQAQVYEKKSIDANIYLMNMPTGSGKTLCSMKFALERAIETGKKRIIYVIPYNSIIDQTVQEFEKIFGDDSQILRHQSTFSFDTDDDEEDDIKNIARLASENWDAQMIITTSVQFFESLYANKKGKLRKLHNIANSIIVFDEAHLMPINYLEACLRGIIHVTRNLNSEAIFLTATMPNFKDIIEEYAVDNTMVDLVPDKKDFAKFKKCSYVDLGWQEDDSIVQSAMEHPTALIVTNTKLGARTIYQLCTGKKYYLSTYMTAEHRASTINEIREELDRLRKEYPGLKNVPEEKRITVISTSLIEAGVDLDFSVVFRELTNLDSILQAGGRCNREGHLKGCNVFVFGRKMKQNDPRPLMTSHTEMLIKKYDDISSPEAISEYYKTFFEYYKGNMGHLISDMCSDVQHIPFADYSVKIIDNATVSIVVAQDEKSAELVNEIKTKGFTNMRALQKYCCNVNENELKNLLTQHAINDYESGIFCLTNKDYYDENTGIKFIGEDIFL